MSRRSSRGEYDFRATGGRGFNVPYRAVFMPPPPAPGRVDPIRGPQRPPAGRAKA